ncbi:MAG TPA: ferredoxin [Burkholderiales bacterium]|nr:ferredoxin [Burkholderiales bacterium]
MFAIVTSKPGQFRTELADTMREVERYDYVFCGRTRASFVIAELAGDGKVRIVEESGSAAVNFVPAKLLPRFDRIESARAELEQLVRFGNLDAQLVKR